MARLDGRANDELRPVMIIPNVNEFAEGSVMVKCGKTHVNITASVEERVPPPCPGRGGLGHGGVQYAPPRQPHPLQAGYLQAEAQWPQCGDPAAHRPLPPGSGGYEEAGARQITIDCDVLQGDGGTRTASITGGFVALALAVKKLMDEGVLEENPIIHTVAAVSAGIVDDVPMLDLQY